MMKRTRQHPSSGFTVIELLTSIAIFGLLSVLVIANFKTGGFNDDLRSTSDQMVSNIRRVQNLATVGQTTVYQGKPKVPGGGYGISIPWVPGTFNLQSGDIDGTAFGYTMFADFESTIAGTLTCSPTPNELYDVRISNFGRATCGDQAIEAKSVSFKPKVVLTYIALKNWDCDPSHFYNNTFDPIDIAFKPPHPTPLILGCSGSVSFEISHTLTRKCRTITINAISGQVSERAGSINPEGNYTSCNLPE